MSTGIAILISPSLAMDKVALGYTASIGRPLRGIGNRFYTELSIRLISTRI